MSTVPLRLHPFITTAYLHNLISEQLCGTFAVNFSFSLYLLLWTGIVFEKPTKDILYYKIYIKSNYILYKQKSCIFNNMIAIV